MKTVELEASYVLGTDISENIINLVKKTNNHPNIEYKRIANEEIVKKNPKYKNQLKMPYFMIIMAEK